MGYRSTNKTVYSARYRIFWCLKYRHLGHDRPVETGLEQVMAQVVDETGDQVMEAEVMEAEVMPDHTHLLAEVPPMVPLSKLVQTLKGRSSPRLGAEFPVLFRRATLWSRWWFVATVGGGPLEVERRYVENPKAAA